MARTDHATFLGYLFAALSALAFAAVPSARAAAIASATTPTLATASPAPDPELDASAEAASGADLRHAETLKEILIPNAKVVAIADDRPADHMPLRAYLAERLGKKFHPRRAWAGSGAAYAPRLGHGRVWEPIGPVRVLTIHHAEGVPDEHPAAMIRNIFRGHTTPNGRLDAADVGYHFFVDRDGEVWEGRDAAIIGTHVGSRPEGLNNAGNLGICGLGTFLHEGPPRAMVDGIVQLSVVLSDYYGRPLGVRGHEDWVGVNHFTPLGGIDCPGRLERAVALSESAIARDFNVAVAGIDRTVRAGEGRTLVAPARREDEVAARPVRKKTS